MSEVPHLELLVEEVSMEAFLRASLPRLVADRATFEIRVFRGKQDLLKKLPSRLRGYRTWLPESWRLLVVLDRDDEDCGELLTRLEGIFEQARLVHHGAGDARRDWQVVGRLAIEELEAWYFGDWAAVRTHFPKLAPTVPTQARYRNPDAIAGGTWEALERLLQAKGYYPAGLAKIEVARKIGAEIRWQKNRSPSFGKLRDVVLEVVGGL